MEKAEEQKTLTILPIASDIYRVYHSVMSKREIKFRAWDTVKKQMIFSDDVMITMNGEIGVKVGGWEYDSHDSSRGDSKNKILQQFTGLPDENGVEICEGDILEISGVSGITGKKVKENIAVEWDEEKTGFWPLTHDASNDFGLLVVLHFDSDDSKDWKIVGNIYQNPELLK